MGEEIFRKKSMDKFKSPENLNDYLRVSNPAVWLLLISVIVLLAGACVWGILGHIDSIKTAVVQVEENNIICYLNEDEAAAVETGMTVKFNGMEGTVAEAGTRDEHGVAFAVQAENAPEDGVYAGEIVLKRFKPISFILN